MQDMVKQIVEMDRKAREITDAAQLEKVSSEKEILKRREELRETYLSKARKRISANEPKERAAAEADWQKVQQKYAVLSANMDELYAKKGDEWVNSIVSHVIGE